jgi:hypothetical protein
MTQEAEDPHLLLLFVHPLCHLLNLIKSFNKKVNKIHNKRAKQLKV